MIESTLLLARRYFSLWPATKCEVKSAKIQIQIKVKYRRPQIAVNCYQGISAKIHFQWT